MKVFDIKPLVSMGPLELGATRSEIEGILGISHTSLEKDGICQLHYEGFCIHLNRTGKAEFIAASIDDNYSINFLGIDLLREEAANVIDHISSKYQYDETDFELG